MSPTLKFLIGLAAVLLMGWIHHGPLGHGAALVDRIEGQAQRAVAATEVPGVAVALGHHPLSRAATLSGPADDFQREGQGEQPGLTQIVRQIDGVSKVSWADEAKPSRGVPLLAETLLSLLFPYLLGLGLAWLVFGRTKKEGYL